MIRTLLGAKWIEKLKRYQRIVVGFSGGLDSTVLLHNLAADTVLLDKLTAMHINHGLSANAVSWQNHCQQFCKQLAIPLVIKQVDFPRQGNIEAQARQARYQAFATFLEPDDCLILGHHADDQAETLLLQLFRGAGIDGLAAMVAERAFANGGLFRPLLDHSRQVLEDYAQRHQLQWINDETNQETIFSRNYIRHQVLPVLRERWPSVAENLIRTANHCQQARANLDDLARIDCPELKKSTTTLSLAAIQSLSYARLVNVLRVWLKINTTRLPNTPTFNRIINEVMVANVSTNPKVVWQDGCVTRYRHRLYLIKNSLPSYLKPLQWNVFPEPVFYEGLGKIYSKKSNRGLVLSPHSQLEIRFRQGGELFNWRGQHKQLKKLFQEWNVPPWLRTYIPLLYVNDQLAAVIGFAVADNFYKETVTSYQLCFEPAKPLDFPLLGE